MISHLFHTPNYTIKNLGKKIVCFKRFNFVDTDKHIAQNKKITTLIAALSSYQTILPCVLHSEEWSCVWMGNSDKSAFLHQRDLEFSDSHGFPTFPPAYPINCQEFCIFWSFSKIFTLYIAGKNVGKLTVIQTSTVPLNPVQVSSTSICLFFGFVLFWAGEMSMPDLYKQWKLPTL